MQVKGEGEIQCSENKSISVQLFDSKTKKAAMVNRTLQWPQIPTPWCTCSV